MQYPVKRRPVFICITLYIISFLLITPRDLSTWALQKGRGHEHEEDRYELTHEEGEEEEEEIVGGGASGEYGKEEKELAGIYVIGQQVGLDITQLQSEIESQQIGLKFLQENKNSPFFTTKIRHALSNFTEYGEIIMNYQGVPTDIFLWLILPLVMAQIAASILRHMKPAFKPPSKTEYPLVPLIYFQQTYRESITKRENRKQLTSIARNFIIRANETYIDLDEIRNAAVTRQTLARSPWALVRFMIRLQILYSREKKAEEAKLLKKTQEQQQQQVHQNQNQHENPDELEHAQENEEMGADLTAEHEKFAHDVMAKIEATHHHPESRQSLTSETEIKKTTARDLLL